MTEGKRQPRPSKVRRSNLVPMHSDDRDFLIRQSLAIAELGQLALEGAGTQSLLELAASRVATATGAAPVAILLADIGKTELRLVAAAGYGPVGATPHHSALFPFDKSLVSRSHVLSRRSPGGAGPKSIVELIGATAGFSVPLGRRGARYGVLVACTDDAQEFVQFLKAVAHILSAALDKEEADAEENRRLEEESVLSEITRVMSASLEIEDVYPRCAAQLRRLLRFDRILISTVDWERREFTPRYMSGTNLDPASIGVPAALSGTAAEVAIAARHGIIVQQANLAGFQRICPNVDLKTERGLRSLMMVPLFWRGAPVGVIAFRSATENAYQPKDLELAERIAGLVAAAVANSVLHQQVKDTAHEQAVLAEIGRIVGSSLDVEEVFPSLAGAIAQLIPFDRIVVNTIDRESATVTFTYLFGTESTPRRTLPRPLTGTVTAHIARTRTGLVVSSKEITDPACPFETLKRDLKKGLRSTLAVPLMSRNIVVGALILQARQTDAYAERDLFVAAQLASQMSGAVANAVLHADLQKAAHEYELLAELERGVPGSGDLPSFLGRVHRVLAQLIPFAHLSVRFLDPALTNYSSEAHLPAHASQERSDTSVHEFAGEMPEFKSNEGVAPNAEHIAIGATEPRQDDVDSVSEIQASLRSESRLLGNLTLTRPSQQPFSQSERNALERATGHIAAAVESILAFQQTKSDSLALEVLSGLASAAAESRSLASVCRRFSERLQGVLRFDLLVIAGFDLDHRGLKVLWGSRSGQISDYSNTVVPIKGTAAELVAATGHAYLIGDIDTPESRIELPKFETAFQVGRLASGVVAPIHSGGQAVGTFYLLAADAVRYGRREIQIAESAAALLGNLVIGTSVQQPEDRVRPVRRDSRMAPGANVDAAAPMGVVASLAQRDLRLLGRPIGVFVIDENFLCRQGIRSLFKDSPLQVLDEFPDSVSAMPHIEEHKPAVVVWEIHAHGSEILKQIRRFRRDCAESRLLLVDNDGSAEFLREAVAAGASSYLLKGISPAALVEAVLHVTAGGSCVDPKLLSRFLESLPVASVGPTRHETELLRRLSEAEIEILKAVALGRSNGEIAQSMLFATGTIRNRVGRIYRKIGVADRSAATSFAIRAGLVR